MYMHAYIQKINSNHLRHVETSQLIRQQAEDVHHWLDFPNIPNNHSQKSQNNTMKEERKVKFFSSHVQWIRAVAAAWLFSDKHQHRQVWWLWRDYSRRLVLSALLGCLLCIRTYKLSLTAGPVASLNVAVRLLSFFFVKSWTWLVSKLGSGFLHLPAKRIPLSRLALSLVWPCS